MDKWRAGRVDSPGHSSLACPLSSANSAPVLPSSTVYFPGPGHLESLFANPSSVVLSCCCSCTKTYKLLAPSFFQALDIFECLVKRERKKRDLVVSRLLLVGCVQHVFQDVEAVWLLLHMPQAAGLGRAACCEHDLSALCPSAWHASNRRVALNMRLTLQDFCLSDCPDRSTWRRTCSSCRSSSGTRRGPRRSRWGPKF